MKQQRKWLAVLSAASVFLLSVSVVLARKNASGLMYIENQNRRAFTELTQSVRNIDVALSKAVLTTEPQMLNQISHEITANASFAKSSLGQLPMTDVNIDKTQKYLAQVGDYTVYIAEKTQRDESLSQEEVTVLLRMLEYADHLTDTLEELEESYIAKSTTFSEMLQMTKTVQAADEESENQFTVLEKEFGDYPRLIYDGAFSDHLDNRDAEYLSQKPSISKKDAQIAAKNFLGAERVKSIKCTGESENSIPAVYSFSGKLADDSEYSIDITKNGGEVLYYLNNKENHSVRLTVEEAVQKGIQYIESLRRGPVASSYYEIEDAFLTLNLCPLNGDVKEYPDLMKLRISLYDGEILAYEAKGYLMNHRQREIPQFRPLDSMRYINPQIAVSSVNRALIPKDDGREVYAYEIKGKLNNRDYLVYINAQTGATEQILLVVENENGVLTE